MDRAQLQALRASRARQTATVHTFPPPIGGWNSRDSLDQMKETDAVELQNLFPGFGNVSSRKGFSQFASGLGAQVYTLAEFNAGSVRKFLAAANGKFWNITNGGTAVSVRTGFTSDKWQWAQFDNASNQARMGFVNGQNTAQVYDGSAMTAMTLSGTGVSVTAFDGICVFKNRTYFWNSQSQDFFYSAVNALGGALTRFPLGRVQGTGGNLTFMATWSRDAGDGADDLAVFALSSGDVLIYQGSDPGSATDWALIGVFHMGAPLSIRSYAKVGADLWIITKSGYIPLSKILPQGRAAEADLALSSKIRGAVSQRIAQKASYYGWQPILYPQHSLGTCCVFNVPLSSVEWEQHVLNTATGAWCKFTGINTPVFGLFNDSLYFGGNGKVYKLDDGTSDAGVGIAVTGQTAWNYCKNRGQLKELTMTRLSGGSSGAIDYYIDIGVDFGSLQRHASASTVAQSSSGAAWDTSDWDTAEWAGETSLSFNVWHSTGEIGFAFSARLTFQTSTQSFDWTSLAYAYKPGAIL